MFSFLGMILVLCICRVAFEDYLCHGSKPRVFGILIKWYCSINPILNMSNELDDSGLLLLKALSGV